MGLYPQGTTFSFQTTGASDATPDRTSGDWELTENGAPVAQRVGGVQTGQDGWLVSLEASAMPTTNFSGTVQIAPAATVNVPGDGASYALRVWAFLVDDGGALGAGDTSFQVGPSDGTGAGPGGGALPLIPQGQSRTFLPDGADAPATVTGGEITWDILLDGASVATSDFTDEWEVSWDGTSLTVYAPWHAVVSDNYEVRYSDGAGGTTAALGTLAGNDPGNAPGDDPLAGV